MSSSSPQSSSFRTYPTDPAWLQIAARELRQHERPGADDNPRILSYFDATDLTVTHDEVAWCSAFVNWCLREAGYRGTRSALAASWLQYGQPAFEVQRGAIVVLNRRDATPDRFTGSATGNHVAFLLGATVDAVECLGGNQSDQVKVSRFPRETYRVRTVRMPRACDRMVLPQSAARAA